LLAIEGQFYLLWPFALILVPRHTRQIAVGGIIVAVLARLFFFAPLPAYFATLTRMDAIFVGCLCAIVAIRLPARLCAVGLSLVFVAAALAGRIPDEVVLPIATAGSAIICTSGWGALGKLSPIGRRAYGLYLWNWPMVLIFPAMPAVLMTFATAEPSHRLVERRWLRPRTSLRLDAAEPGVPIAPPVAILEAPRADDSIGPPSHGLRSLVLSWSLGPRH
jgi:peptidoglycan/LPS O-acetylase OafA/YrhL